jgi:hypothetical protein
MTPASRRAFLTSSTALSAAGLGGLLLPAEAHAAAATQCRTFHSDWTMRKIAIQLILGIGYEVGQVLKDLPPGGLEAIVHSGKFKAFLATLQKKIDGNPHFIEVDVDQLNILINGQQPNVEKARRQVLHLLKLIAQKLDRAVREGHSPRDEMMHILHRIGGPMEHLLERATVDVSYRIRFGRVVLYKRTTFQKGHLQLVTDIREPVGCLNCLHFSIDARECDQHTTITTTLGIDYNIGRREGPLVRRIAQREIASREATFLCKLETLVYDVIHRRNGRDEADLRRIIPEMLRRIEAQEI